MQAAALPSTQTSCPPAGTARAAVLPPLTLGKHPTIAYTVNEFSGHTATFGTLKRYDVTTRQKTEILKLPKVSIETAQVSADGQWLLFTAFYPSETQTRLQLVRMDGRGLQTLYCSSGFSGFGMNPQWSTNQKLIAFDGCTPKNASPGSICLLNTVNGRLQAVLAPSQGRGISYLVSTWLDNTHIYLQRTNTDQPPGGAFLLDTSKGSNQTDKDLLVIEDGGVLGDLDSSFDGKYLYFDHGFCGFGCFPPSSITVQPALGGKERTIFSSKQYDAIGVRAVTPNTLLFIINNQPFPPSGGTKVDQSHNGLWSIHTDGTGLKRLTTDNAHLSTELNPSSQLPWSNVSRDGRMYVAEQVNFHNRSNEFILFYGSLNGGTRTTFADIADGTQLSIAGWTTM